MGSEIIREYRQSETPYSAGHRGIDYEAGEAALLDVAAGAIEAGVSELTVFAFSTENWKRSPEEVRFLMGFRWIGLNLKE